ncbi:rRNA maturation RNase YbeY [Roseofilum capinflatum]|uniref:Endoribonuclease YbeY n=1 Tax=Roseofilum capinflatum BLCC-M114 TaxID=3022440 RepID=A0ABT7B3U6_9CYAN|nr:rRNA maturation RNase YbeY [Roseofilum capinflatum]MDJ1173847.1 rRNA maturation RNase YbeY [Roseofilum capinflatum BLCC-M114]
MDVEVNIEMSESVVEPAVTAELLHQWLCTWLEHLDLNLELPPAPAYELSLRLTDNSEIQSFNSQYRQQDRPTDVLAFAALESDTPLLPESEDPLYLGDLMISVEMARDQAEEQGHSETVELAWLCAHGLLHLLGWDHPDEASLQAMWEKQDSLLVQVGLELGNREGMSTPVI